jgi:hypothetical protein
VSGEVTLDGQPLKQGLIKFDPVDGKTPTADAKVIDGKYTAEKVPVGDKIVRISASKVVGKHKMYEKAPDSPWVEDTEEVLPPRYNVQSDLKMTIGTGSQEKNFPLTSK